MSEPTATNVVMVLLVFVPVLAALTTAPLLISQRLGGQRGLWIATLLVVTLLGWWRSLCLVGHYFLDGISREVNLR
jgi:hypothetical protein